MATSRNRPSRRHRPNAAPQGCSMKTEEKKARQVPASACTVLLQAYGDECLAPVPVLSPEVP